MSNYPPGTANDPRAPWNARDNEQCPRCDANDTWLDRLISDETWEEWECNQCQHRWSIQIGRDPDELRDAMRDDKLEDW
jgi:hypothetical protein